MTVAIRMFVVAASMFIIWLAVSFLVDESVFNISLFYNSRFRHKIQTIDTNDFSRSDLSSGTKMVEWNTSKICEDEEFGENVGAYLNAERAYSSSHSISYGNKPEIKSGNNSLNFQEKNAVHSSSSLSFNKKKERRRDSIVQNAVWPFCWFGGKTSEEPVYSPIPPVSSSECGLDSMVSVPTRQDVEKNPDKDKKVFGLKEDADKIAEEKSRKVFNEAKDFLPSGLHVAESLPNGDLLRAETSYRNESTEEKEAEKSADEISSNLEHVSAASTEISAVSQKEGHDERLSADTLEGADSEMISETQMVNSFVDNDKTMERARGEYGELQAFPPVEETEEKAFSQRFPHDEAAWDGERNYVQIAPIRSDDGNESGEKIVLEEDAPTNDANEKIFQDSTLNAQVEGLTRGEKSFVSEAEGMGKSVLEDRSGIFPVSPGEPEIAPITGHYGVRKPAAIPDVPTEEDGIDDALVIEDVSELDSSEVLPVNPAD